MTSDGQIPRPTEDAIAFHLEARMLGNPASGEQKFLSRNEARLLELLLEGPQTKEALIQRVWGEHGVVVTDASYYQLVTQVRNSFEELGLPRKLIHTIPRYGLELLANYPEFDGEELDDEAELNVVETRLDDASAVQDENALRADLQAISEAAFDCAEGDRAKPVVISEGIVSKPASKGWFSTLSTMTLLQYLAILLAGAIAVVFAVDWRVWQTRMLSGTAEAAWIKRDVSGMQVYVKDPTLSAEAIATYISKVNPKSQCADSSQDIEYYFEETTAVMQMLVYGSNSRLPCATYYFY
ncbi:winged helix-turn-helix domain-containing protein [Burkholderia sp. ABCPW 14]|uniref:winged helix-turn-helix domain-containing protein n=1 Tax=Burkholderia sp. ABCPW 14 TaxID=1637860 RepID=UPI0018D22DDA|nr:winged helix-turn-helix domain-containing protein [Burkholderia sp. ABCPW 14]